jgi:GntR family transcriptional regulator
VNEGAKFQTKPLYLQVRDAVLDRIKSGNLRPGGLLPSEMDLHRELGVSLGTLRKALDILESDHLIVREPGRGTFVRDRQPGREYERFNPIRGHDGKPPRENIKTGAAKLGASKAPERVNLQLDERDQVVRFERLRYSAGRPFAYELVCLPHRLFPDLALQSTIPDNLEELAQRAGLLLARAVGKIRAVPVSAVVARALGLTDGAVVLGLERLAFDTEDRPVEMMTAYYNLTNEYCNLEMR